MCAYRAGVPSLCQPGLSSSAGRVGCGRGAGSGSSRRPRARWHGLADRHKARPHRAIFGRTSHSMRLQPVRSPDALHRTDADPALMAAVQCVASPGGSPSVRATMPSATSAPNGAIRDRRVLSRNKPSKPSSMKRCCQRHSDLPC